MLPMSPENASLSSEALCLLNQTFQGSGLCYTLSAENKPCELESYLETISFPAFNYLHAELSKFAFAFFSPHNKFASFRLVLFYICDIKVSRVRPEVNEKHLPSCVQGQKADVFLAARPSCDFLQGVCQARLSPPALASPSPPSSAFPLSCLLSTLRNPVGASCDM